MSGVIFLGATVRFIRRDPHAYVAVRAPSWHLDSVRCRQIFHPSHQDVTCHRIIPSSLEPTVAQEEGASARHLPPLRSASHCHARTTIEHMGVHMLSAPDNSRRLQTRNVHVCSATSRSRYAYYPQHPTGFHRSAIRLPRQRDRSP